MSKESRSILCCAEGRGDVENSMGVREQLGRETKGDRSRSGVMGKWDRIAEVPKREGREKYFL